MSNIDHASGPILQATVDRGLELVREIVAADREAGRNTRADALEEFADATEECIRRLRNGFEGLLRERGG